MNLQKFEFYVCTCMPKTNIPIHRSPTIFEKKILFLCILAVIFKGTYIDIFAMMNI